MSAQPQYAGLDEPGGLFTPEDLLRYQLVTALHGVPGGEFAAYAVKSIDRGRDTYLSALWTCSSTGECARLTSGEASDRLPRVSPDGRRVAFASDRHGGKPQIYLVPVEGGSPRQLTDFKDGVVSMWWSPRGDRILASADIDKQEEGGPEVAWRLPYKQDGFGFTLARETHLFGVDPESGAHTQLTSGSFEVRAACWSPDGERIAFTRTRAERFAHRSDLWIANADGSDARRVTDRIASVSAPAWSPDGRWILFAGSETEGDSLTRPWLYDCGSGDCRPLGDESLEVVPGDAVWAAKSDEVVVILARRGRELMAAISVPSGQVRVIEGGDVQVSHVAPCGDRLAFTSQDLGRPNEIYLADWSASSSRRVTRLNPWWEDMASMEATAMEFEVPDGKGGIETIEGWLLGPRGEKGALPLLVDVHGGPGSYVLFSYHVHPHWPVLCSNGWRILALNAVGSSSFGPEFASRLNSHWGELDFPQHQAAVRQLQREGLADSRIAISGKSYGGYVAAWAIGRTHDFRAAIVMAPVANLESHFSTSDSGYYADRYVMDGSPWDRRDTYQRLSPMQYAHGTRTPVLLLQGKDDQRCPIGQSEEFFAAVMCNEGTPAQLAMYPKGSHHFLEDGRPAHRVDATRRIVEWLSQWVQPHTRQT